MKKYFSVILAFLIFQFFACSRDELKSIENEPKFPVDISKKIEVINGSIYKNNQVIQLKGVNALNSFGISKNGRMKEWNVEIVREFIGNLREQPISGGAINDAQGQFLHSLDSIVIEHRKNNRITIICPFGWVDNNGNQTLFTGKNPSEMSFYDGYKSKLKSIASFFKDQEDVWIQTWNEPYHFKNENGYSHELWLKDSREMVENLRSINGFTNIIVVPGNEQGQGETALLEKGELLLTDYSNILFDLHAYGKWHDNASLESLKMRLFKLQVKKLPFRGSWRCYRRCTPK